MTTKQEIFDKVAKHLLTQNERATHAVSIYKNACKYRAVRAEGKILKCAVGVLIPDEVYDPDLEGMHAAALCDYESSEFYVSAAEPEQIEAAKTLREKMPDVFNKENALLLYGLQKIHDNGCVDTWKSELQSFAVLQGLVFKESEYR